MLFLSFLTARWTLPLTDVLAVRYGDDWIPGVSVKEKQTTQPTTSPSTVCPTNFILHYAVRGPGNKWRHHSVTMSHTDPRQVASWVKTIRNYLLSALRVLFRTMIHYAVVHLVAIEPIKHHSFEYCFMSNSDCLWESWKSCLH